MTRVSTAVLRALVAELEGDWRLVVTPGGRVVIALHWMEWTGMGSEPEHEVVFQGEPEEAFNWLCRRVNNE